MNVKYTVPNAVPQQPAHWIFYVYRMHSQKKKKKNHCYPIPTTARIKAIKLSVKNRGKVPNPYFSICYIKCLLVTALESNYSLIAV